MKNRHDFIHQQADLPPGSTVYCPPTAADSLFEGILALSDPDTDLNLMGQVRHQKHMTAIDVDHRPIVTIPDMARTTADEIAERAADTAWKNKYAQ